jgi:hypothetical protein
MSMPLMLLAWNSTIADAHVLEIEVIVASGSPPAHRPLTAFPTASAHAAVAWFLRWNVLLEKAETKPAPFAEKALLLEHTCIFASCGRVYASAWAAEMQRM